MLVVMVRIPVGSGEEGKRLEERFRNRAGLVDSKPGFMGFELLKGDGEYISVTRWATRDDLNRWMQSQAHAQAHGRTPRPTGGGHPESGPLSQSHPRSGEEAAPRQGGPSAGSTMMYEVVIPGEG